MVPYFEKHGAKQLYCIYGNQLSLATQAVGTGKAVAMLCSIPSVSKDVCNTYNKDMSQVLFPGSRSQQCKHVCFSATNHWIAKVTHDDVPNQNAQNLSVLLQSLQCLSTS